MGTLKCKNGHFFDKEKFNICPLCNIPKDEYLSSLNLDSKKNILIGSEWKLDAIIGVGSYGKVYRILRKEFEHTYEAALKIIEIPQFSSEVDALRSDGMSEQDITEYFRKQAEDIVNEVALMSKLKGKSNIVSYEDHSIVPKKDGFGWEIYIRMECLTPLYEHIRKHPLSERDVIQLGIDICHALEVCHKHNIIHHDIKPENIFVSDNGTYKLGDFGIARQLGQTSAGLAKTGTLTYMAPEIYLGKEYNASVDIYSLGIVLYRFLNDSRAPFLPPAPKPITVTEREKATQRRFGGEAFPPPCKADEALARYVLKACSYNAEDRYQNAFELRKDLESLKTVDDSSLKYINETLSSNDELVDEKTVCFSDYIGMDYMPEKNLMVMKNEETVSKNSHDVVPNKLQQKIIKKMINWICFTCLFSLMPFFIYLFLSGLSDSRISIINKCISDFLYFGLSISVITIKEMLSFELWKKDKGIYMFALFVIICILIFSSVFFGAITMNELNLLKVKIADEFLFIGAIIIFVFSFLTGAFIQVWEVM